QVDPAAQGGRIDLCCVQTTRDRLLHHVLHPEDLVEVVGHKVLQVVVRLAVLDVAIGERKVRPEVVMHAGGAVVGAPGDVGVIARLSGGGGVVAVGRGAGDQVRRAALAAGVVVV